MFPLFILICHALGAASCVHAVMTARTSQGAIAWAVSLLSCPYLAVPAYWVLGRSKFHGYTNARQGRMKEIADVVEKANTAVRPFMPPARTVSAAAHAAERVSDLPLVCGNAVDLLVDGAATFASILDGLASARSYILFQFFIVHDDEIGRLIKERLIEKAKSGVRVSFLYDEVGSYSLPQCFKDDLRRAGIEVYDFHTRKGPWNRFQLNFRNHRKIVVVDGSDAWLGGHNVGDEYLGRNPRFGHWRDTHVRIQGPAAIAAQLSFVEDWYWATGRLPEVHWKPTQAGNLSVLIVPSSPADEFETATLMFVHAINSATKQLWIASPYFVPDAPVIAALQLAGLRGVDVRILIPDKPDHLAVYLAAFSYFREVGQAGVKLYRYMDGFLHEKVLLIDHAVATIGTANFDNRSFRLNFEITAVIADQQFAAQVERMFLADFAKARLIDPAEAESKAWWFRFAVQLARLTAPIQ